MKFSLPSIILVALLSIIPVIREKITCRNGCESIQLVNNRVVIEADVAGERLAFIVGLAHTSEIRSDNVGRTYLSVQNKLIECEKKEFDGAQISFGSDMCPNNLELPLNGIYGHDLLAGCSQVFSIDFEKLKLCNLSNEQKIDMIPAENFLEVDSRFSNGKVKIALTINWKVYWFTVDTAYDGTFLMGYNENLPFLKEPHTVWERAEPMRSGDRLYYNKGVWLNGTGYNSSITTAKINADSKVGVAFLKGFNWIFDHTAKKVYFKKNSVGLDSFAQNQEHQVSIINNKLVITARRSLNRKYDLGSIISAINGVTVTSENICEVREQLVHNINWQQIGISIVKETE